MLTSLSSKLRGDHLSRAAFVYIRQSSAGQVANNRESTERQYALKGKAMQFGWAESMVQVVDEDLGQSGATATNRAGFQRLAGEVSLGRVGAIFSLEVSRLARSSADWHRLLDLCALSSTLIADDDGLYDPNDFNDRLILGMKGTMSDAERHVMRLRLSGGRLHKAQKGKLITHPPTGFVHGDRDGDTLVLDPDEHIREAIKLAFDRFRLESSAWGVVRYFREHGLKFPTRIYHRDESSVVAWKPLTHSRVLALLHSPAYAGAYAYGRRKQRRALGEGGAVRETCERVPQPDWIAFIKDSHAGYISWEEHMDNMRRLEDNRVGAAAAGVHGVPRNGPALLQGIVLCGKCGRRMGVQHITAQKGLYVCHRREDAAPGCWSVSTRHVDEEVAKAFLQAVVPPEIDLSLTVMHEVERQTRRVDRQWQLRLERARYEAERAERQYNCVEPENRTVARTLEARWNGKLEELARLEHEHEQFACANHLSLSAMDKKAIMALARDLPRVWNAPTTTQAERKQLLRMLVDEVVLEPSEKPTRSTKIRILWKTGATSETRCERPAFRDSRCPADEVVDLVRVLATAGLGDRQIADELSVHEQRNATGGDYSFGSVRHMRIVHGIPRGREPSSGSRKLPDVDAEGRFSVNAMAKRYAVSSNTVMRWIRNGLIPDERSHDGRLAPYRIAITPELDRRIRGAAAMIKPGKPTAIPDLDECGRLSLNALAKRIGVSRSTIAHWTKRGLIRTERDWRNCHRVALTPALVTRLRAAAARLPSRVGV